MRFICKQCLSYEIFKNNSLLFVGDLFYATITNKPIKKCIELFRLAKTLFYCKVNEK